MSLGFEQAGFDVVAAVEIDPIHCTTHQYNFPNTVMIPRSVEGLSATEIRTRAGIRTSEIDCVFGGPPCQGFSLIGQRSLDDSRNNLVIDFIRITSELNARSFVFENVKGLTLGSQRAFLDELIAECSRAGYELVHPWRVLNACRFGVPQDRERVFLLGVRRGETMPRYPSPTSTGNSMSNLFEEATPTCIEALGDLPDAEQYEELRTSDHVSYSGFRTRSSYASSLRCEKEGDWHFGYRRNWDPHVLTSSARTEHSSISRRRFSETPQGSVEPISRFFRLAESGISNTLRAGTDATRGAFTSPRPIHYEHARCITVREMGRLHGFPDWFRFHATKWHGARQIGNSVPPPLARAVAAMVLDAIAGGSQATIPNQTLNLGDDLLLQIDMSKASLQLNVEMPIQKRDRRSGRGKRSQMEIEASRLEHSDGRA